MQDRYYTRYERARIISARALQIAQGAPVLVEVPKDVISAEKIAELEWGKKAIPIDTKVPETKTKSEDRAPEVSDEDSKDGSAPDEEDYEDMEDE